MSNFERQWGRKRQYLSISSSPDNNLESNTTSPLQKSGGKLIILFTVFVVGIILSYLSYTKFFSPPGGNDGNETVMLSKADIAFRNYLECLSDSLNTQMRNVQNPVVILEINAFKQYKETAIDSFYALKMSYITLSDHKVLTKSLVDTLEQMALRFNVNIPKCYLNGN